MKAVLSSARKAPSVKVLALAGALFLGGCATQAEQACQTGQPLAGQTFSHTCQIGQSDRAQINSELWAAAGVAAVGLAVAAVVIEGSQPRYQSTQTVVVNQTAPQGPLRTVPVVRGESAQAVLTPVGPIWGVKE